MYPKAGDQILVRHTLPRFATTELLAAAKGQVQDSFAAVPGVGVFSYQAADQMRPLRQDDFYNLDGWVLDGEGTWSTSGGSAAPSPTWPTIDGQWRGPTLTLDLGQGHSAILAAVELDWLNNSVGALGRVALDLLDAGGNILAAVEIGDGSAGQASTYFQALLGAEANLNGNATGSPVSFTFSTTNPHSFGGWMGVRRDGSSWEWFGPTGVFRSSTSALAQVRQVRVRAQVFRSGGTNWPAITAMALKSTAILTGAANSANLSQALALGGAGFEAFIGNAFDGNTGSQFVSQLNGSANYGGATYLGQTQAIALRYPRLAFVAIRNSTNSTPYHPSAARILFGDTPSGPWDVVANFSGLSQAGGAINYLPLPVGLHGRRCWVVEPVAGLGPNPWTPAELQAFYGSAQPSPDSGVEPYFLPGFWRAELAQGSVQSGLGSYLAW